MARGGLKSVLWSGRRKWVTSLVALLLVLLLGNQLFGKRIRFWSVARELDSNEAATVDRAVRAIQDLGRPYRGTLAASIRRGGWSFRVEHVLLQIAFAEPFYLADDLRSTLASEKADVRHPAVVAYLDRDRDPRHPTQPIADDLWTALARWAKPENLTTPGLGAAVNWLKSWRDPRIPDLLVPLLRAKSTGKDMIEIGRANSARQAAAAVLVGFVDKPEVADALVAVVKREGKEEASRIRSFAWQALAAGGWHGDPKLYWLGARSDNPLDRQMVADNLEKVHDPEVIPILAYLLDDPNQVVRRGAVDSLSQKRAPVLMDRLLDLAEDRFSSIRGDLAQAVRFYRAKQYIPFLGWCLTDTDPNVVEKAIGALNVLAGRHYGFDDDQWAKFRSNDYRLRRQALDEFMNSDARKSAAVAAIAKDHPPRYTDWDRVPHLITMLGHADPDNVRRAMRNLAEITGRKDDFDPVLLDPAADPEKAANAMYRFTHDEKARQKAIADWRTWWSEKGRDLPEDRRPEREPAKADPGK